jgi:hypothetical protein
MRHSKRPLFQNEHYRAKPGLFSVLAVIPQIIIIAIVLGIFYYIRAEHYFPLWLNYIYYAVKFIIAIEILIAAARSLIVPLLAIVLGALHIYYAQVHNLALISDNDAWQLILIGGVGIVVTFIVKLLRK